MLEMPRPDIAMAFPDLQRIRSALCRAGNRAYRVIGVISIRIRATRTREACANPWSCLLTGIETGSLTTGATIFLPLMRKLSFFRPQTPGGPSAPLASDR